MSTIRFESQVFHIQTSCTTQAVELWHIHMHILYFILEKHWCLSSFLWTSSCLRFYRPVTKQRNCLLKGYYTIATCPFPVKDIKGGHRYCILAINHSMESCSICICVTTWTSKLAWKNASVVPYYCRGWKERKSQLPVTFFRFKNPPTFLRNQMLICVNLILTSANKTDFSFPDKLAWIFRIRKWSNI